MNQEITFKLTELDIGNGVGQDLNYSFSDGSRHDSIQISRRSSIYSGENKFARKTSTGSR